MNKLCLYMALLILVIGAFCGGCASTASAAQPMFPFFFSTGQVTQSHAGLEWNALVKEWVVPGSVKVISEKKTEEKTFADPPIPPAPNQLKILPAPPGAGTCTGPNCPLRQFQGQRCVGGSCANRPR